MTPETRARRLDTDAGGDHAEGMPCLLPANHPGRISWPNVGATNVPRATSDEWATRFRAEVPRKMVDQDATEAREW